ncbi:MAG: diguanylate cyclase [Actinomycetota bacterium]|nr:diguanylate cyclase [Actinomycetota bacterium]
MGNLRPVEIVDVSGVALRRSAISMGLRVMGVVCGAAAAYSAATISQPHRVTILELAGLGLVSVALIALLPTDRIVRSRWNGPFFIAWSIFQIALVAGLASADGGARSPLALGFFIPILFAAVSYPLPSVVAIGAADVLTFLGLDAVTGPSDPGYLGIFAAALAIGAILCASQAKNQDDQRRSLAQVSRTDPLTGALNRRGFEERLDAELSAAARIGDPLSLLVLDLDKFKQINDTEGHPAGDELLRWTVGAINGVVRPRDDVGRLGGDEFAVLLPGVDRELAVSVAHRVTSAMAERIHASVGITCYPADALDREDLLTRADAELYDAKPGRERESSPVRRDLNWAAALAHAVDSRMAVAHEHSSAVADNAAVIATELGWSRTELALLRMAAMLHDVGKVSVPDRILRKPGPLTDAEFAEVAKHPVTGADIVGRIGSLAPIVPWIRHAHEHWDGSGYPDGLSGEAIPLASRILLVADAFDAMTSDRPYRKARSPDEALTELRNNAASQFDPRCVAIFDEHLTLRVKEPEPDERPAMGEVQRRAQA